MDKINWVNGQSGGTPLSAENLNLMQDNAENAINEVADNLEQIKTDLETKSTYSTEERIIGKWIDGKPIYRKVIYSDINANGNISIEHGIENLDLMIDIKVNYNRPSSSGALRQMINPRTAEDGNLVGIDTIFETYFVVTIPSDFGSSIKSIYAIMEYTKTTD